MSHDTEAAYASSEVADMIMLNQTAFFGTMGTSGRWSVCAMREGGHQWPLADGVIFAENATHSDIKIAFEYKRPNEGVHGILTALGQSLAYLEKGYNASVIVMPDKYSSHSTPGAHIKRVIDATAPDIPISIYTYTTPDLSAVRPFQGKLNCVRAISLSNCRSISSTATASTTGSVSTLWAHMREGMSHPDAFFRFCQAVKIVTATGEDLNGIKIPLKLSDAVKRIAPGADIYKYLSNTPGDTVSDMAWRYVWFRYYFWNDLMPIYKDTGLFTVNDTLTKIRLDDDGHCQGLFSGRSDSIKSKLVSKLNANPSEEDAVWEEYAIRVRKDSHSYREVIDSGLYHIGFLAPGGTLTDLGYKYVDACERVASAYAGIPMEILRAAVLQNGQYGAMLHYFYKLSEEKFESDLFAFAIKDSRGNYKFDSEAYLSWLDDEFTNTLHLAKKSTTRAGGTRKPFQAELSFLKKMGFVKQNGRSAAYRVGVGLEINWPQVQHSMMYFNTL
ncbi:MAG: hypothetical protein NC251_08480 [Lachnoclostridium sp.]|nr:hypothetical protein [Lachnospira sp.]MCM1248451.1 hypothetical protein [Lachnoclostridium sp.]MCM1536232.1 hypothetical protein [Clostridium sp.]